MGTGLVGIQPQKMNTSAFECQVEADDIEQLFLEMDVTNAD